MAGEMRDGRCVVVKRAMRPPQCVVLLSIDLFDQLET